MSNTIVASTTVAKATGQGTQTHIIYAANSARWWAFYLSSTNVLSTAYSSDGVTWTAGATKTLANAHNSEGRNFSVAYANIASTDVVHIGLSYASATIAVSHYHLRATISGTTLTFGTETQLGSTTGNQTFGSDYHDGVTVLIDSNNKVHDSSGFWNESSGFAGDADIWDLPNADTGTAFTYGTTTGTPTTLENLTNQRWSSWMMAMASGAILEIHDDGQASTTPTWDQLRLDTYSGTAWASTGGTNNLPTILPAAMTVDADANDWCAVKLDNTHVMVVYRDPNQATAKLRFRIGTFSTGNTWTWTTEAGLPTTSLTQPTSGSGIALYSDQTNNVWCAVLDGTASANNVKYCKFNTTTAGAWSSGSWGAWTALEATSATRTNIGVTPQTDGSSTQQLLVYWTEGSASPWSIKGALLATTSGGTAHTLNAQTRAKFLVKTGLKATGRDKFLVQTGLKAQTRDRFLVQAGLKAQTHDAFLIRAGLKLEGQDKFFIRTGLNAQARDKFLVALALKAQTRSRFLIAMALKATNRASFFIRNPLKAYARSQFAIRNGLKAQARARSIIRAGLATLARDTFKIASNLKSLAAQTRVKFVSRTGLKAQTRDRFSVRIPMQLGSRSKFLIRVQLIIRSRSRFAIRIPMGVQTRARFLVSLVLKSQAQSRFLINQLVHILPFSAVFKLAKMRLNAAFASPKLRLNAAFTTAKMRLNAKFSRSPAVANPSSSIQVPVTITDSSGALVSNIPTVNVTVTFPDGTSSSYALGTGVTNSGNGVYTLSYVTKGPGQHQELWNFVQADGTEGTFRNTTEAWY